jgi:hypothetical protein
MPLREVLRLPILVLAVAVAVLVGLTIQMEELLVETAHLALLSFVTLHHYYHPLPQQEALR